MNKELTVTRSNDLVQSSYFLSLNERRLIECSIAKIKNGNAIPSEIKVTAAEFGAAFSIKTSDSFKELKAATRNLRDRLVRVKRHDTGEDWEIRWVDAIGYQHKKGYVKISFSQHVRPYLEQLNENYTKYKLLEIRDLKTVHAMRLYELIMQYKNTGYRKDTVKNIKKFFGVEDKYPVWAEFSRNVLKKSITEINKATNYNIEMELVKDGRNVVAVIFRFGLKDQIPLEFL